MKRQISTVCIALLVCAANGWPGARPARCDGLTLEVKEATPQANPSSREIAGTWNGKFWYREGVTQAPVEFRATLTLNGTSLGGQVVEPETQGDQVVGVLKSEIVDGVANEDGTIQFSRKDDGTGWIRHSVEYDGVYSPDGSRISGTWTRFKSYFWGHWKRKSDSGPFEMHRQP